MTLVRSIGIPVAACAFLLSTCGPPVTAPADRSDVPQVAGLPDTVTFAEVAPIFRANCMPCHRAGQAGPFPLISYNDVRRKLKMVRKMVVHRWMPPWPADTAYTRFIGEKTLNARQIALIAKWADQGAPVGDTSHLPPLPVYPEGSLLGKPDAVVWMPDTFHIPGDNRDRFMIAKAPFQLERDTFLRAVEFVPGNRRQVHHMNGALVSYAPGAKTRPAEGSAYIDADSTASLNAYEVLELRNDDGTWPALTPNMVNYLPGLLPAFYPPGIGGYRIPRTGAFLMNTLHYGPSMKDTTDRSHFNLWFTSVPPERPMREFALGTLGMSPVEPPLIIPADSVKTFTTQLTVPKDISVLSINPHMHLLGKRFLAFAITPERDTIPLIRINDWDFRWQFAYTFRRMVHIPRGSLIKVVAVFDNTRTNPNNPFDPPRTAREPLSGHMRTTDEMLQFFVNYVDYRPGDENISLEPGNTAP
jgi:hypothetical protein